mgnify:FL=1|jgi:hypothetical protein
MGKKKEQNEVVNKKITPVAIEEVKEEVKKEVVKNTYIEIDEHFDFLEKDLVKFKSEFTDFMVRFRKLRKDFRKYGKDTTKKGRKTKMDNNLMIPKRKPTGFQVAVNLSKELCDFLNVSEDTKLNCSEVSRRMNIYFTNNSLQEGVDIKMDKKLKDLLKPGKDEQVTYFNLQKYLKKHYIKNKN